MLPLSNALMSQFDQVVDDRGDASDVIQHDVWVGSVKIPINKD